MPTDRPAMVAMRGDGDDGVERWLVIYERNDPDRQFVDGEVPPPAALDFVAHSPPPPPQTHTTHHQTQPQSQQSKQKKHGHRPSGDPPVPQDEEEEVPADRLRLANTQDLPAPRETPRPYAASPLMASAKKPRRVGDVSDDSDDSDDSLVSSQDEDEDGDGDGDKKKKAMEAMDEGAGGGMFGGGMGGMGMGMMGGMGGGGRRARAEQDAQSRSQQPLTKMQVTPPWARGPVARVSP
jgi:hypothetical protein